MNFVTFHLDLGVTVDRSLKFYSHVRTKVTKVNGLITNVLAPTVCREPNFMTSLYVSHNRPLLDYAYPVWNSSYLEDLRLLDKVLRRWTRFIRGLETLAYDERLNNLHLFSLHDHLLRDDFIMVWKIFHRKCWLSPENFFVLSLSSTTLGHPLKKFNTE